MAQAWFPNHILDFNKQKIWLWFLLHFQDFHVLCDLKTVHENFGINDAVVKICHRSLHRNGTLEKWRRYLLNVWLKLKVMKKRCLTMSLLWGGWCSDGGEGEVSFLMSLQGPPRVPPPTGGPPPPILALLGGALKPCCKLWSCGPPGCWSLKKEHKRVKKTKDVWVLSVQAENFTFSGPNSLEDFAFGLNTSC